LVSGATIDISIFDMKASQIDMHAERETTSRTLPDDPESLSVHDEVSLPVTAYEDICQKASVILLLAEAFRHGATVEAEHRLTV
jgi:hypothetical protein